MLTKGRCSPVVKRSWPAKPGWRVSTLMISSRSVAPSAATLRSPPTVGRNMDGTRKLAKGCNRCATECLVVDQLVNGRVVAAQPTRRVARDLHLAELHAQAVEHHQSIHQRIAQVENQLDRLDRLNRADDAAHRAEYASLGTARDCTRRRWRREQAAVA